MRTRRALVGLLLPAVLGLASPGSEPTDTKLPASSQTLVFVGTYTGSQSRGIYCFQLQSQNDGAAPDVLIPRGLAAATPNPSFLALDPRRRLLFAVNEVDRFEGKASGAVSAFAIDSATGQLKLLSQRPSLGTGPCHLVLDRLGKHLLIANYTSGSVAVLPVAADGRLGEPTAFVQHVGKSINPERQSGPHAHCVTLDAENRFAFVCDLGLDQVRIYHYDAGEGKLTPADPAFVPLRPGSGPRHLAFRPDGRFAYVVSEMSSTITTFAYDPKGGKLREIATVPSLPPNFNGTNSAAEISVLPNGRFLYVSNRGENGVGLFAIDREKGTLRFVEEQGSGGKKPRHFGIEASGGHIVIANQDSNNLLLCRIDSENAHLQPAGMLAQVPSPACAAFLPPVGRR